MKYLILIALLSTILISCKKTHQNDINHSTNNSKKEKAKAILKIKIQEFKKFRPVRHHHYRENVKILEVLKNNENIIFKDNLIIEIPAQIEIPKGESIIYIDNYDPKVNDIWVLLAIEPIN